MTFKATTAVATPWRRRTGGFARMTAFLLVAAVVLADVIRVCECRTLREENFSLQRGRRVANDENKDDFMADSAGPTSDEDEDSEGQEELEKGVSNNPLPSIQTSKLIVEIVEGTTVNLPCKIVNGSNMDDLAVFWINGTKSIMTDDYVITPDVRVKPGKPSETSTEFLDHTLIIEQVTRWDSGSYTCRIASTPPVEITHTLHVTGPAKILSVGDSGSLNTGGAKKVTVKQGEPVQLVCVVSGYPEPTVQWTRKSKYHQHPIQSSTLTSDQDQKVPQSTSLTSSTVVVSNTNEVRIESVVAYRDAGTYECLAHNSVSTGSITTSGGPNAAAARSALELEVEYPPDVVVLRSVVNTGETYDAQMACSVQAYPKVKVTWEKELVDASGVSSSTPVLIEGPNSRYETYRLTSANNALYQGSANSTTTLTEPTFVLKVKKVQGPQDFGRYRCRAENRQGISYSDYIKLSGSPAQPLSTYVQVKDKAPELAWTVDSWSPVVEYQLQYMRQQDSSTSWMDVKPQPQVVETTGGNSGDERQYAVSYVFSGNGQSQQQAGGPATEPLTLQHGTTYVARLRAQNVHGWSDWSAQVVFSGGMDDSRDANEINQHGGHEHNDNVSKASVGASGVSGLQQYCNSALVTSITLTVIAMASTVASAC